jgi:slit 2
LSDEITINNQVNGTIYDRCRCECSLGWHGVNCTDNLNDCSNHICQFGVCVDALNGYTCKCDVGFSGKYCEIAPQLKSSSLIGNKTQTLPARCSPEYCSNNGMCYEEPPNHLRCRCYSGFIGDRCFMLKTIHSSSNDSYMKLPKPNVIPRSNITISFSTTQSSGVLVYFGHLGHMVAEIFMGRIRVSYDVGNSPGSVMFSYDTVNDGKTR